jgi:hypothetical protein
MFLAGTKPETIHPFGIHLASPTRKDPKEHDGGDPDNS